VREIFAEAVEDIFGLEVPEGLELEPLATQSRRCCTLIYIKENGLSRALSGKWVSCKRG
jgi:hypothetical protein